MYDVVEYLECLPKRPGEPSAAAEQQRRVRLGVVAGVQQRQQAVTVEVEPLVMEEEGVWRHDEEVWDEPQKVAVDLVLRVVDADYSQVGVGVWHWVSRPSQCLLSDGNCWSNCALLVIFS